MSLSPKDIIELSGLTTYRRGESYFRERRVRIIKRKTGYITAEVRGSKPKSPYNVILELTDDEQVLSYSYCNCLAFEEYSGICKHIVATLLEVHKIERKSLNDSREAKVPERKSDNEALTLLRKYIYNMADRAGDLVDGQAVFEPVLEWTSISQTPSLFFRVGEKRMYIVPDLGTFKSRFQNQETASYGKFTLWHGLSSFTKECRPLLEFFLKRYDDYNYLHSSSDHYRRNYYPSGHKKKNMYLSPPMMDELFSLLEEKHISVRDEHQRMDQALIIKQDFDLSLELKKTENGAILSTPDRFLLLKGDRNLYVMSGSTVYCCSEEFSLAAGELLSILGKTGGQLFFAEREMGMLFSSVIPRVSSYIDLNVEGEFEQYKPLPLVVKIYLDAPNKDSVTAKMTFAYGDKTVEAFCEKHPLKSMDIIGEMRAQNLLCLYFDDQFGDGNILRIDNDTDKVYRLVTEGLEELSEIAEIYTTDAFAKVKVRPPAGVSVGVRVEGGLLQLNYDLEDLDLSELPEILASYRIKKKYHRLQDGSFLMLEESALGGLSELAEGLDLSEKQLTVGHAELPSNRALYLDSICKKNEEMYFDRDRSFRKILRDMREVENADFPIPASLRRTLRNYQRNGYRWMKTIAAYGFGGILADDMGLGKTLQVLALLQSYKEECSGSKILPSIVVCPSSLALNWESEVEKFTPQLRAAVITGSATERKILISGWQEYDLMITSYDLLKRDMTHYEDLEFQFVIIDEAQYIKNQGTKNAKAVKSLKGKVRFALTGTPVENSLAELWSIFDFLMPGYLFAYSRFKKKFETPIVKNDEKDVSNRLKQLVAPFLLRRLKKDVLKELPPKIETVLHSAMEEKQRKVYLANLVQIKQDLLSQTGLSAGQERIKILAALTRMRQICCDPSLLYENYEGGSTKLSACMELVENCVEAGRRILLFSQFTSMLDIIEERLKEQNLEFLRIDGSTKPSKRLELVNGFNAGSIPVFLISLKAGGTGLNLTGADVVIHYDPWWNLSVQNQATDRAHRIGQKNKVQVYKLIVKDTIEERILKMQEKKADLANTVIEENADPFERLNQEDLIALFNETEV